MLWLIQPVFFFVLACMGSLILADTILLWRDIGLALWIPLVQYALGGVCWLAIGGWGLVTGASLITQIPGPWADHEATALVSTLVVVSVLVEWGLVDPPRRHLVNGPSPALLRLIERFS